MADVEVIKSQLFRVQEEFRDVSMEIETLNRMLVESRQQADALRKRGFELQSTLSRLQGTQLANI